MKHFVTYLLAALCMANAFGQTTITLQPGASGIDAHFDNNIPNTPDNNYPVINAGYNTVGGNPTLSHNLIQFDLSAIPTGSTIVSATLSLWHSTLVAHSTSNQNEELLAKVTQAWTENTVTWNNQPTFSYTDTIHIGTTNIGDDKPNINITSFVQSWVDTPANNFGMVMHLVDEPGTLGRFQSYASSDDADSTVHPKLVITFIPPCSNQTTVLQPDGSDGKDAHFDNNIPNTPDNNYPVINAGYNTVGGNPTLSHNLLQFNFSQIPTGATVVSATLSLWHSTLVAHSTSNQNEELLAKVTQAWTENTVTWNNQPTFSSTDTIHIGTTNIGDDKPNINITSFVQDWVNNPSANYGMCMHLVDEPGALGRFQSYASSDDADSTVRPKLVVVWNNCAPTAVNEIEPNDFAVSIFPNPANSMLHIKTSNNQNTNMVVYDMLGNKMLEIKNTASIDVSGFATGFYLVQVSTKEFSKTLKFMKE